MISTYRLNNDKTFSKSSQNINYVGENDVEILRFVIHKDYNGLDMSTSSVLLFVNDTEGILSTSYELSKENTLYSDSYYVYNFSIPNNFTTSSNVLNIWLSILTTDNELLKTEDISLIVIDKPIGQDLIPSEDMSAFEQMVVDVDYLLSQGLTTENIDEAVFDYIETHPTELVNNTELSTILDDYVTETVLGTTLNGYTTDSELTTTLGDYVTETALSTTLGGYVEESALTTTLGDYVLESDLTTTLSGYTTDTELGTILGDYITETNLGNTLADYPTETELGTVLGDYVTDTQLSTSLGDYVLESDLTTTLSGYTTDSELSTVLSDYVTETSLSTELGNYPTETELGNVLADYVTDTELGTALGDYQTESGLTTILADYPTETELGTILNDYVTETSLGTTLGYYVTDTELGTTLSDYVTDTSLGTTLADYVTETSLGTTLGDYTTDTELTNTLADYPKRSEISSSGGYEGNIYLTASASIVNPSYYALSYTNDLTATISDIIVTNTSEVLVKTYISDLQIGVTTIDSGTWKFTFYVKQTANNKDTRMRVVAFKRHANGVEENLFEASSYNIVNTDFEVIKMEMYQPTLLILETDRLGFRFYISTTAATNTVTCSVGDGYGCYVNTPLSLRHDLLRDKNGNLSFQHVTSDKVGVLSKLSVTDNIMYLDSNVLRPVPNAPTTNPQDYILDGSYSFVPKSSMAYIGGGGMYLTNEDSTIVVGYDKLSYTNSAAVTEHEIVVNNNEVLGDIHLFENVINTTQIDSGNWAFSIYCRVSSASGVTRIRGEVFVRTNGGTIVPLFSVYSQEINNLSSTHIKMESYQSQFSVNADDRLGFRLYATTTHNANISVFYTEGGVNSSYIVTPLHLRHSQLRALNEDVNYQHINATDRNVLDKYPAEVIDWGTTYTATILPNKFNLWGTLTNANTLAITLGSTTSGIVNQYMFEFKTGASVPAFSAISGVTWIGSNPTLQINKTYQFSIINGIGAWAYA